MDKILIGKHNSRLTDIRRSVRRGALTDDGLLAVEGGKLLGEALCAGLEIDSVILCDGVPIPALPKGIPVYSVQPAVFKSIQSTEHSQGLLALIRPRAWTVGDVLAGSPTPVVVLARLQDPGNVGTILRVSEAFGAAGCLGLTGTASIHNPKVVRASAGSVFRVPHSWDVEPQTAWQAIKSRSISLIGTSPHAERSITSWDWSLPAALLIGNEGSGLSPDEAGACDILLRIPQQRELESLNSAIATSIILYEAYRRRLLQ